MHRPSLEGGCLGPIVKADSRGVVAIHFFGGSIAKALSKGRQIVIEMHDSGRKLA